MANVIIGIDPGKDGACAVMHRGGWIVTDNPTVKTVVNKKKKDVSSPVLMAQLLQPYADQAVHVFIERVGAMKGQGVTSMFSFGTNYGMWQGVCAAYGFAITHVAPVTWKKQMLPGMDRSIKGSSIMRALQLFPQLAPDLTLKKHDGRAEAILLAAYGAQTLGVTLP